MHTYIANRALAWAGRGPWSLGPNPGLHWARAVPGLVQAWSQARASRPGLGPRLQGPGPAYVSALLAKYI